jgi:hypothetical protein
MSLQGHVPRVAIPVAYIKLNANQSNQWPEKSNQIAEKYIHHPWQLTKFNSPWFEMTLPIFTLLSLNQQVYQLCSSRAQSDYAFLYSMLCPTIYHANALQKSNAKTNSHKAFYQ